MKVKADLHNHLRTSSNLKQEDFNRAIDLARQKLGENGIFALVNFSDRRYEHFIGFRGYERVYAGENRNAVYVPEKKVLVVKGQEVPTKQGHLLILGLGYDSHMKQHKSLEYTLKEAKDKNAIVIAEHPYSHNGIGPYLDDHTELHPDLNAIEIHNGETLKEANQKTRNLYRELKFLFPEMNIGALSSSDGHSLHELGKNWTEIEMPDIQYFRFLSSLKDSIINTNLETPRQEQISYRGIIQHIFILGFTMCFPEFFETDKPGF